MQKIPLPLRDIAGKFITSLAQQAVEIARKFEKLYSQRQVALRSDSIH